ncbi:MAG: hypothetical protein Q4B40_06165 [Clostridia bacterium]|nr:hypothetical protein [Clostridia bacterium]
MRFFKKFIFPFIVAVAIFVIIFNTRQNQKKNDYDGYMLKAYKNSVALYKNDIVIEVYNDIVLNTLPQKDIQSFNQGISVFSKEEAETLIENYDG